MTTHPALVDRPSSAADPATVDEFSLAALLELFAPTDPAVDPVHPSLRNVGPRFVGWMVRTARRAAAWGAVAGVGPETTGGR